MGVTRVDLTDYKNHDLRHSHGWRDTPEIDRNNHGLEVLAIDTAGDKGGGTRVVLTDYKNHGLRY